MSLQYARVVFPVLVPVVFYVAGRAVAENSEQLIERSEAFFDADEPRALVVLPGCNLLAVNRAFRDQYAQNVTVERSGLRFRRLAREAGSRKIYTCVCSVMKKVEVLTNVCVLEALFADWEKSSRGQNEVLRSDQEIGPGLDFVQIETTEDFGRYFPIRVKLLPLRRIRKGSWVVELVIPNRIDGSVEVRSMHSDGNVIVVTAVAEVAGEILPLELELTPESAGEYFDFAAVLHEAVDKLESGIPEADVARWLVAQKDVLDEYAEGQIVNDILRDHKGGDHREGVLLLNAIKLRLARLVDGYILRHEVTPRITRLIAAS